MAESKIKSAQAPIYRATERLLKWIIPIVESLPKSLPYQTLGGLLMRDLRESLDAIIMALQASNASTKLGCIEILIARMTTVKTTMRMFTEMKRVTDKGTHYIVTPKQEAQFLELLNPISAQAGGWLKKTKAEASMS